MTYVLIGIACADAAAYAAAYAAAAAAYAARNEARSRQEAELLRLWGEYTEH